MSSKTKRMKAPWGPSGREIQPPLQNTAATLMVDGGLVKTAQPLNASGQEKGGAKKNKRGPLRFGEKSLC